MRPWCDVDIHLRISGLREKRLSKFLHSWEIEPSHSAPLLQISAERVLNLGEEIDAAALRAPEPQAHDVLGRIGLNEPP